MGVFWELFLAIFVDDYARQHVSSFPQVRFGFGAAFLIGCVSFQLRNQQDALVILAKAGIHPAEAWIPAFAGKTIQVGSTHLKHSLLN